MKLRSADLSWREVDNDVVVLDERTWKYIHLNASASVLWRALAAEGGASEDQLERSLIEAFPAAASSAAADVSSFLDDLRSRDYLAA